MALWSRWCWGISVGLGMSLSMTGLVHLLQLESYQFPGYFRAVRRTAVRSLLPGMIFSAWCFVLWVLLLRMDGTFWTVLSCLVALMGAIALLFWQRQQPAKKALVVTPRVRRLLFVMCMVNLLLVLACVLFLPLWVSALLPLGSVLWLALSAALVSPVEKGIQRGYFHDAQRKLKSPEYENLLRIGVTGSYGKTSVKYILGTLLSEKYQTLITPESFNTTMGVTRIIREQLEPRHQVFVAEMGARHVGDIRELCDLVSPTVGILTAVGPQHLETFGSLERVISTKYELIESLPADGIACFAGDHGICEELYKTCPLADKHLAGEGLTLSDLELGTFGSRFTLSRAGGESVACQTVLLGRHNIDNILLCATVALRLGLSLQQVGEGIGKIAPIQNRLQVLDSRNGIMVINDGFSGNVAGSEAALAVLRDCPGRRFIVTPGMVEMGERQAELNHAFGKAMQGSVDVAILVGRINAESLREGMLAGGFEAQHIHQAESLEECQSLLGEMLRVGDTVLFENDLPENYL